MSDFARGPGWWLASDQKWYPPESHPDARIPVQVSQASSPHTPETSDVAAAPSWNQSQGAQGHPAVPPTAMFYGPPETAPPPSASKSGRRRLVAVLAVVVVALVVVVSLVVVLGKSTGGLSGKTAGQVMAVTVAAAKAQGSVHLGSVNTSGPAGGGTYDVGASEGRQTVVGGTAGNAELLVVPGHAYVKGDAAFLKNSFGFPASFASSYAGKWISFVPSDPGYQQIVDGDTLSSALVESTPTGTLTLTPTRTVDGQTVEGVSGGLPHDISQAGAKGSVVVYVSTNPPYLPVEVVTTGSLDGQSGTTVVTFSRWGEAVAITAPGGATPISSISS
jgi:hypothetical protein